ncbi:MAG: OpgC domain-containing protein [Chloroflexi bacterium]|nr:OpgC domain-containing protein [Chloroflexota bacterium]
MNYIDTNWHYPRAEKRDLRLDFLRGFAVFVMVVDHFGGTSWFYYLTGNNQFFTSGAEAFVLISGMVVGLVYGNIAHREGLRTAMIKALQRAWTLYKLTIAMTLVLAVLSDWFDLPWAKDVDLGDLVMFVVRVIFLQQTYYLADIPMLYTFLMALAPLGLWLLHTKRTGWLHVISFVVWAGFQYVDSQQIIILPIVGNTTFHPAAWQLIFFWAMAFGYHRDAIFKRIAGLPRWPYFLLATLLFLWLLHLYSTEMVALKRLYPGINVEWVKATLFSKSHVAPGRVLATAIVFQFAYLALTRFWVPFERGLGWLFTPLGQNSLYSYTMHVVIIGAFYAILPYLPGNVTERGTLNTLLQLGVLLLLWLLIKRQFAFDIVPR